MDAQIFNVLKEEGHDFWDGDSCPSGCRRQVLFLADVVEQPTTRKSNCPGAGSLAPPGECYGLDYEGLVLSVRAQRRLGESHFGFFEGRPAGRLSSLGLHPPPRAS